MTIIGHTVLAQMLASERLIVSPTNADSIQPTSIDIRLGRYLKISEHMDEPYDFEKGNAKYIVHDLFLQGPYELSPSEFVLGMAYEYIELPLELTATLEGKSSVGRFGLVIQNAGRVDPKYRGKLTLELLNSEKFSVLLKNGMPIGQLVFAETTGVTTGYGEDFFRSRYNGDVTPQESRLYMNYD